MLSVRNTQPPFGVCVLSWWAPSPLSCFPISNGVRIHKPLDIQPTCVCHVGSASIPLPRRNTEAAYLCVSIHTRPACEVVSVVGIPCPVIRVVRTFFLDGQDTIVTPSPLVAVEDMEVPYNVPSSVSRYVYLLPLGKFRGRAILPPP